MTTQTKEPDAKKKDEDNEPLLTLETLAPKRPTIEVDGTPYELKTPDDLDINETAKREREVTEYQELFAKKNPTKADGKRLKLLLDTLFDEVLIAPKEVKAKISDHQRTLVVRTFSIAPTLAQMLKEARQEQSENGSTTEN